MDLDLACTEEVNEIWQQHRDKKIRFSIFKTNEEQTEVQLEHTGDRDKTFEDFKELIPKDEPRWAIFDLHLDKADGSTADKLILVHYSPDNYFGPLKFFFATAKAKVESFFVGYNKSW